MSITQYAFNRIRHDDFIFGTFLSITATPISWFLSPNFDIDTHRSTGYWIYMKPHTQFGRWQAVKQVMSDEALHTSWQEASSDWSGQSASPSHWWCCNMHVPSLHLNSLLCHKRGCFNLILAGIYHCKGDSVVPNTSLSIIRNNFTSHPWAEGSSVTHCNEHECPGIYKCSRS